MARGKMRFETVPLEFVRQITEAAALLRGHRVMCAICGKPVDLERCKTDRKSVV